MLSGSDPRFQFEFIAPPDDLREQVNTYFLARTTLERMDEIMPAYSGQLLVFVQGTTCLHFEDGTQCAPGKVVFSAPLLRATPFTLQGPIWVFGASFTHRGWAELVGQPVNRVHHRYLAPHEVFDADLAERFASLAGCGREDIETLKEELSSAIREAKTDIARSHVQFISQTLAWLSSGFSPPVEDLFQQLSVSKRQAQRLSNRFFGVPPKQLLKHVRAVRAATLLAQPELADSVRDELLLAYFDQSHLINDIRRYTGRTPTLLEEGKLVIQTFDPSAHGPPGSYAREPFEED